MYIKYVHISQSKRDEQCVRVCLIYIYTRQLMIFLVVTRTRVPDHVVKVCFGNFTFIAMTVDNCSSVLM